MQRGIGARFEALYGRSPALYRAPGRVNIIGEYCDFNEGFVMPVNTGLHTWLAAAPRADRLCRVHSTNFDATQTFHLDSLEPGDETPWLDYVKGVAWVLQDEGVRAPGLDVLIHGEIPLGGGLSSSASLESVLAYAWLDLAGAEINLSEMAQWCRRAENEYVGVQCGIMDQYVICLCPRGHAMKLDCRSLAFAPVPLPPGAGILVVETGVHHQLSEGGYNTRRSECEAAVTALAARDPHVEALRDVAPALLEAHGPDLEDAVYRRARHVVGEIRRVHAAEEAMRNHDLPALGALLNASHASLRDDFEVSCEELDTLTAIARDCPGVHGSRMVGAGWGGCAIALVDDERMESVREHVVSEYARHAGRTPWSHVVQDTHPVGRVAA